MEQWYFYWYITVYHHCKEWIDYAIMYKKLFWLKILAISVLLLLRVSELCSPLHQEAHAHAALCRDIMEAHCAKTSRKHSVLKHWTKSPFVRICLPSMGKLILFFQNSSWNPCRCGMTVWFIPRQKSMVLDSIRGSGILSKCFCTAR